MAFPSASESFRVTGTFVRFDGTPVEGLAVNFIPPRAVQAVQNYEDDSVYPTFSVTGVTDENGKLFAAKDVDNPDRVEGVELLYPYGKSLSLTDWHYIAEFVDPATNKSTRLLVDVPNTNVNLIPNGSGEFRDLGGWAQFTDMTGVSWETDDAPAGLPGYVRFDKTSTKQPSSPAAFFDVEPGAEYLFEAYIRADVAGSRLLVEFRDNTNAHATDNYAIPGSPSGNGDGTGDPGIRPIQNREVPTTWTRIVGRTVIRPGVNKLRIYYVYVNHYLGAVTDAVVDIAGLRLSPMPVESVDLSDAIPIGKRDDFDEDLGIYLQAVTDAREARDKAVEMHDKLVTSTVSSGEVVGDDLILTRSNGTTVNAGNVRGAQGVPSNLSVESVTLPSGSNATASLTGTAPNYTLNLGIPRGNTGTASAAINDDVVSDESGWTSSLISSEIGNRQTNLIPNGALESGTTRGWSSAMTLSTDVPANAGLSHSLKSPPTTPLSANPGEPFRVDPTREYLLEVWLKADKPNSHIYIAAQTQDGSSAVSSGTIGTSNGYLVGNFTVPTTWTRYQSVIKFRPTAQWVFVNSLFLNHANGSERNAVQSIAGLRIVPLPVGHSHDAADISSGTLATDRIGASSITADKMLIAAGNLFPDPYFRDAAGWVGTDVSVVDDANFEGGKALEVIGATAQRGTYYRALGSNTADLQPGTTYRVRARVTVSGAPGRLLMYFRTSTGTSSTSTNIALVTAEDGVGTHDVDVTWTIPNNAVGAGTLGIYTGLPYVPNSVFRVGNLSVQPMASGHLIVDGSVTAEKVAARSITADRLVLGSSDNLIPNGSGEFGSLGGWATFTDMTGVSWETDDAPAGLPGYVRFDKTGTRTAVGDAALFDVEPGAEYLFEAYIRANVAGSRLYVELRPGVAGQSSDNYAIPGYPSGNGDGTGNPGVYLIQNREVPTTWTRIVGRTVIKPDVNKAHIRAVYANHWNGTVTDAVVDIAGLRLQKRASADLIADGAVTTAKVAASAIATKTQAEQGTASTGFMTPLRTKQAFESFMTANMFAAGGTSTQAQAEQGTVSTGFTTPLSTKQAFESFTTGPSNAVFIGASNVVAGTWPEKLCTKLGLTPRNFAVGGTGFTHGGPSDAPWSTQLTNAINSTAFSNSDVKYVFVAGGGNDARASGSPSVLTLARSLFTNAVASFPNAKLVVVPMLWNDGVVIPNAIRVAEEMRAAAREVGGQVIWHAWEWLYGHSEWMADATHPNAAGYDQFVQWIMQGLNGSPTYVSDSGVPTLESDQGVSIRTRLYWQVNAGIASITGDINLTTQNPSSGTILMRVPPHAAPGNTTPVPVNVDVGGWSTTATCFIYNDGYVRAYTAPGGTGGSLAINANWTHTM